MTARQFVLALGIIMAAAGPVLAHHSFAAEFDANRPVTLKGTLTKVEWINPHGWIHIDVKSPDGKLESWAIETGAPNTMIRRGLRKSDLPIGIEVTIQGFQAKDGSRKANGRTVTTADGKNYFTGSSGGDQPKDDAEKGAVQK